MIGTKLTTKERERRESPSVKNGNGSPKLIAFHPTDLADAFECPNALAAQAIREAHPAWHERSEGKSGAPFA